MAKSSINTIKLTGIAGYVKGTSYVLLPGTETVIGRSRECTICLREAQKAHQPAVDHEGHPRPEKGIADHFKTVSHQHLRITFVDDGQVMVEDLSRHGVFLDGHAISKKALLSDLDTKSHELRLGTNESFRIELQSGAAVKSAPKISVKKKA
ncbi:MAG: FHA domain-containing protein [Planctomycetes bacterium]|nr:FHA domain-containing protein [Planctomycetota bacterium]